MSSCALTTAAKSGRVPTQDLSAGQHLSLAPAPKGVGPWVPPLQPISFRSGLEAAIHPPPACGCLGCNEDESLGQDE